MYAFIQNIRNVRSTLERRDFNVKPRRDNGEILTLKQRRSVNVAATSRLLRPFNFQIQNVQRHFNVAQGSRRTLLDGGITLKYLLG